MPTADITDRGYTPREVARLLRISPDRVRALIARGELGAVNMALARCGKPRYVVMPHHLMEFAQKRRAGAAPAPTRKPKRTTNDYYPD